MTNVPEHTPKPWAVAHGTELVAPGGMVIASTDDGRGMNRKAIDNAAFIVRAVNAHDELVKVLSDLRFSYDHQHGGSCDPDNCQWIAVDKALKLAKGE